MPPSDSLQDFKDLLRELFQFDVADLDFGIYRILNEKREDIERFIEEDLVEAVREELEAYEEGQIEELERELEDLKRRVRDEVSEDAIEPGGSIKEEYQELSVNIIESYEEKLRELENASMSEETERRIYDDLARFFRRYYDNGDFITKRRFASRKPKYYVPYDGEEVLLHWANRDQYYIKTTEHFRDYQFEARDMHVHFQLVDAAEPQDDVKAGDTRYFVLHGEHPVEVDSEAGTCTIRFAYRPITESEDEELLGLYNEQQTPSNERKTNDRSTIVTATVQQVLAEIEEGTIRAMLGQPEEEEDRSPLHRHLNRYTGKNTTDYFVHKNLGRFLRGQLEFFIQNEVLEMSDMLGADDRRQLHQVDRAKAVKKIGKRIIDFLAQIEDFQKRLFEKKKFVVDTGYCVTLDYVPDDLYETILDNENQLQEWEELYRIDQWEEDLFALEPPNGEITEAFLEAHPHLMIDTKHFTQGFTDRLLAHLSVNSEGGLSDRVDGVCIQSENLQAINLLRQRFSEQVQCIYTDPPYNTGNDDFLYKDTYRHSSWLSMMHDRLRTAFDLLRKQGVVSLSVDDNEQHRLHHLLVDLLGEENHLATLAVQNNPRGRHLEKHIATSHEYALTYMKDREHATVYRQPLTDEQRAEYNHSDENGSYRLLGLRKRGAYSTREERPNLHFPIYYLPEEDRITLEEVDGAVEIIPKLSNGTDGVWRWGKENIKENKNLLMCRVVQGREEWDVFQKDYLDEEDSKRKYKTLWADKKVNYERGKGEIRDLFEDAVYDTVKPLGLVKRICRLGGSKQDLYFDCYAGSGTTGHALMDMNRNEEGERTYILIEMSECFDTVMMPRLKKVAFSDSWSEGVPESGRGLSHLIQYLRLESYEDALNNIKINEPAGGQQSWINQFDDYELHYMLSNETKESETLLTSDAFDCPFDYTLRIQNGMESPGDRGVDLEATFNYLIGLEVQTRRTYEHQERRYVVVTGQVEEEQSISEVMVVWRDQEGLDLEEEKSWARDRLPEGPFDKVYVNGSSHIRGKAEPIEIPFRERMDPAHQ